MIREALGTDYPLFYDTGLRGGENVVKAYAQGANFTFFGRVLQFAIAAEGEAGLQQMWDVLCDETSITLAQIGWRSLTEASTEETRTPVAKAFRHNLGSLIRSLSFRSNAKSDASCLALKPKRYEPSLNLSDAVR